MPGGNYPKETSLGTYKKEAQIMTNRAFRLTRLAVAFGVAGMLAAGVPVLSGWLALDGSLIPEVHAQDTHGHSEGSTTSHGHSEGESGGKPPWAGMPGGKPAYMSGDAMGGHDSGGTTGGHDSGGSSGHSGGGGPPPGKGPGGSGGGHETGDSGGDSGGTTGGHDSGGGSSHAGGGCGGGGGGHSGGGGCGGGGGGGEEGMGKGYMYGKETHGGGKKHVGHMSGQHGSPHDTGADRHFGGGSGLGGIGGVPEGPGNGRGAGRRYWGGWVIPDDDGDGIPTQYAEDDSTLYFNPGPGGGGASKAASLSGSFRCSDVGENLAQAARFSKSNMERGHEVQSVLQSDATSPDDEYREHALLASFQEEMLKPAPDPTVAGTYLGLIAHTEVTPALIKDVCFHMCVPSSDASTLEELASNAEVVRVAVQ